MLLCGTVKYFYYILAVQCTPYKQINLVSLVKHTVEYCAVVADKCVMLLCEC